MNESPIIGKEVFDKWKVVESIGAGSFGSVYKIQREEFEHTYIAAMKVIPIPFSPEDLQEIRSVSKDEDNIRSYFHNLVSELVGEISLMDKLKGNSNVVSYEDHMVVERTDEIGWDIYIRMELLTPMSAYLEQADFTVADIIILGIHICKALEFCAINEIIHRDIKPQNIFISNHGYFKLGDFGIAKQLDREVMVKSKKGTFAYMAPEIYLGKAYDESVDTYSLGLVLYRLLNDNRTPFLPYHPVAITYTDKENSLTSRMSGLTILPPRIAVEPLVKIIFKACAFEPEDRYSSAADMSKDLEKIDLEPYKKFKVSGIGTDINEASSAELFGGNSSFVIANSLPKSNLDVGQHEDNTSQEEVWGVRKSVRQVSPEDEEKDYSKLFKTEEDEEAVSVQVTDPAALSTPNKGNYLQKFKKMNPIKKIAVSVGGLFAVLFMLFGIILCISVMFDDTSQVDPNGVLSSSQVAGKTGVYKVKYDNGDYYEGNFVGGKKDGKGVFTKANGYIYTGDFSKNAITGHELAKYTDGSSYEGEYVNGNREGTGKYTFSSGNIYEGTWKNNLMEGKGVYTYVSGNVYEGQFVKGLREDKNGKFTYTNGVVYMGAFVKDSMTGYAEKQYTDTIYKGDFVNGNREGMGTVTYTTGDKKGSYYKGEWKADKKSGKVEYYDAVKNKTVTQIWADGKLVSG